MQASEVLDLMGEVAVSQWGLVTTAQAVARGVSAVDVARLADRGLIRRVRYGVYAMYGGASGNHLEDIQAQWLATAPARTAFQRREDPDPVVVSDESAALVYGIGDFTTTGVHLTASRRLRPSAASSVLTHQRKLHPKEINDVDGLPVTSVRRTLEDLVERWEPQHIRDAVSDAISHGLMQASEIARSKTLLSVVPEMAPPVTHIGLKDRLKHAGQDPTQALSEFFRLQFLGLLGERHDWVLKGGTNLLCRLNNARGTRDLDVFLDGPDTADESARTLIAQTNGATIGRYRFDVGDPESSDLGHVDIARLTVQVRVSDTDVAVCAFTVDVAGAVTLNDQPQRHQVQLPVPIPGYHGSVGITLYPIENQLADKLCAMYPDYGQGSRSTRYHDLYDAALIVDQLPFNPATLQAALTTQYQLRKMRPIPTEMPEPAPGWAETYNRTVPTLAGTKPPFTDYSVALAAVQAAVAPTLTKAVGDDARRKLRTLADRQDEAPQREEPQRGITRNIER